MFQLEDHHHTIKVDMSELMPGFDCDAPPEGYYSQTDQYWIIRPRNKYRYDTQKDCLYIGGPGVDGIEFSLLKGRKGVFAYYPISGDFIWKAGSVTLLINGWLSGDITV
jgi:hypothetical protein